MTDATFTTEGHTPVLIEDWLPIRELGIESVRERQVASALPPMSFLHVWWARVPLAAASGVTLTALLPIWDDHLLDAVDGLSEALQRVRQSRSDLRDQQSSLSNADWYRAWILWVCGVRGDAAGEMDAALQRGTKPNFTWSQAYKNKPAVADLNVLHRLLRHRWGRVPRVIDPTAGGGSIPFTSQRYGLPTHANDLNPVAYGILDATLRAASESGTALVPHLVRLGDELTARVQNRLRPFFERSDEAEEVTAYLIANTVPCPRTGGPVPLSPNWWLDKGGDGTAVKMNPVRNTEGNPLSLEFEIIQDPSRRGYDPDQGTVRRGDAVSPWDGLAIDGDYIKEQAQGGRMEPILYAVAAWKPKKSGRGKQRYFRAPTETDLRALALADAEFERQLPGWESEDVVPTEPVPAGNDNRPRIYGMSTWRDMFTKRQCLTHATFIQEWRSLLPAALEELGEDRGREVMRPFSMNEGGGWS